MKEIPDVCQSCGDSVGSRYHEVAHSADVDTISTEELAAASARLAEAQKGQEEAA